MYKGDIEGFPKEIVEKMLDRQFEQTGVKNVSVFERDRISGKRDGGFSWGDSKEGYHFWEGVIWNLKFNLFFEKYPKQEPEYDPINNPKHYTDGGIETIDFIESKKLNYHLGNVVKYVSRCGKKSEDRLTDLKKAMWYLQREIEIEQNKKKITT